jgi:hypothetical protein
MSWNDSPLTEIKKRLEVLTQITTDHPLGHDFFGKPIDA